MPGLQGRQGKNSLSRIRHHWPQRAEPANPLVQLSEQERDLGTLCARFIRRDSPQAWERTGWTPGLGFKKKHYLGVEEGKVVR